MGKLKDAWFSIPFCYPEKMIKPDKKDTYGFPFY
jgi:hypothetical protein